MISGAHNKYFIILFCCHLKSSMEWCDCIVPSCCSRRINNCFVV